ncbi:MAG: ABC transporter substrate-binding protein [Burkholderiales bacterium]|jgi:branched-chain amino acid transport system substrate-binding protein|nr:ABC transporter substrate-binding protein [Burkholderiales bacterium]
MNRFASLIRFAAFVRHAVVACAIAGAGVPGTAAAAEPIRIGSFLSTTGPASPLGDPESKTLKMGIDRLNAAGGVLGRKVEWIVYDDSGDAAKANTFVKRLIESDKVDLIIGGTTTGATMAVVNVVEQAGIPLISLGGGIPIVEPVKKWVFKTPGTDRQSVERVFVDLKARNLTRVGLLSETSGLGASSRAEAQKLAPKYGLTLVADETFAPKDADMTVQLTKIRNAPGVQVVLMVGTIQGPSIATKNFEQLGIRLPLYHTHGVATPDFLELAGKAAEGVRIAAPPLLIADDLPANHPQKAVLTAYRKDYRAAWNDDAASFGGYAWDALAIAVDAIRRAGGTDREKVRAAIEETRGYVGTAGVYTLSPTDHLGIELSSFVMVEVRGGQFRWVR